MKRTSGPNDLSSLLASRGQGGVEALEYGIYCTKCHVVKDASDYQKGCVYTSVRLIPHARGTCRYCLNASRKSKLSNKKRKQTSVHVAGDVSDVVADVREVIKCFICKHDLPIGAFGNAKVKEQCLRCHSAVDKNIRKHNEDGLLVWRGFSSYLRVVKGMHLTLDDISSMLKLGPRTVESERRIAAMSSQKVNMALVGVKAWLKLVRDDTISFDDLADVLKESPCASRLERQLGPITGARIEKALEDERRLGYATKVRPDLLEDIKSIMRGIEDKGLGYPERQTTLDPPKYKPPAAAPRRAPPAPPEFADDGEEDDMPLGLQQALNFCKN